MSLTLKQQAFAEYYIQTGNATEAAIKAGYSKKTARDIGCENLTKPNIKGYIDEKLSEISSKRVADAQEVMEFLSKGMRMELEEEVVVVEGIGQGLSRSRKIMKQIGIKDAVKCAELLGKRYAMFTDKVDANVQQQVVFSNEQDLED